MSWVRRGASAGSAPGASYRAYLLGETDGVAKTPEWAEAITGIPAETIRRLAIEFATTKPAALQTGYAPGRTAFGEQFHRAAYALAAITGNVGIIGGSSGSSNGATGRSGIQEPADRQNPTGARVATPLLADLLARGKAGGYPADIKLIYSAGGDLFNQCPNVNKMVSSLDGVEFIVAQDHFLTPTARYADIVLPATTFWERNDVHTPWAGAGHYAIFMRQAIEPMYECRNDIDIFSDLARRVGIDGYNDKTEMAVAARTHRRRRRRFRRLRAAGRRALPGARGRGGLRARRSAIQTTTNSPRPLARSRSIRWRWRPSPIPTGLAPSLRSPPGSSRTRRRPAYPLALCTPKSRARTHSIHGNQPHLARVDPDNVWLHPPTHAAARGIARRPAGCACSTSAARRCCPRKVTDRIAPGVVSIKEGAWFTPDQTATIRRAAPTCSPPTARRRAARRPTTATRSRSKLSGEEAFAERRSLRRVRHAQITSPLDGTVPIFASPGLTLGSTNSRK